MANRSGVASLDLTEEIELVIAGAWEVHSIDDHYDPIEKGYKVNAWFWHDWKPLSLQNIERG